LKDRRLTIVKNNQKYNKIIIACVSIIAVIIYTFFIIYSNKAHEILIFENSKYNKELSQYNNLAGMFIYLYVIWLHIVAFYVYCLNRMSRLKGILLLGILSTLIFGFCFIMEIALNYYFFKPNTDILQFILILISESVFYFILCIFDRIKNKVNLKKRS
jgi:magnesium-transporting ATPase (P-type)